jgi:hypothetical protein
MDGPVYIGQCRNHGRQLIRGPFALCNPAQLKMGPKFMEVLPSPYSRVGGELNNVVIQGYSNKAHDGFLGHSVIGSGAISVLIAIAPPEEYYAEFKMWHYPSWRFINTGLQFCGLIMGDHSNAASILCLIQVPCRCVIQSLRQRLPS